MKTTLRDRDILETYDCGCTIEETAALFSLKPRELRRLFVQLRQPIRRGRPTMIVDRKICGGPCGRCKRLESFHRDASRSDGHAFICKKCVSEQRRRH